MCYNLCRELYIKQNIYMLFLSHEVATKKNQYFLLWYHVIYTKFINLKCSFAFFPIFYPLKKWEGGRSPSNLVILSV